jgi:hypothetical protein
LKAVIRAWRLLARQAPGFLFELCGLDTEFLKALKDNPDPALRLAMENWRNNAEQKQEATV